MRLRNLTTPLPHHHILRLWLEDNLLTALPPEIGGLEALELLSCSGCPLANLPGEIGRLRNLRDLYLVDTALTPAQIAALRRALPEAAIYGP